MRLSAAAAGVALALAAVAPSSASADTIFDTTPSWDGSSTIQPFAVPDTTTYGQTFVAPTDNVLQSFSFFISGTAALQFQAGVFAWGGSLLGGGGGGATGASLFTSAPMTYTNTGTPGFTEVTINTGGVSLVAGGHYVAFLSLSGPDPSDFTNSSGSTSWGDILFSHVANDGGGGFAFDNNGSDYAALTAAPWDNGTDFGDLAWIAHFTAGGAALPEPGSLALIGLGLAGLGLVRRRRQAN